MADLQEAGTADERRSRENSRRAQQQLLMDGTAVESAFALLLTKVTKLAVAGIYFEQHEGGDAYKENDQCNDRERFCQSQ